MKSTRPTPVAPIWRVLLPAGGLVLIVWGAALLWIPYFRQPVEASLEAAGRQPTEQVAALVEEARERLDGWRLAGVLAPEQGPRLAGLELWLLYQQRRYDELMEQAATAPAAARPHFWRASAQFQKAILAEETETTLGWLRQSEAQFRESLRLFPDDWDTKFNYELVSRLIRSLQDPATPPPVRVLRPERDEARKAPERKG